MMLGLKVIALVELSLILENSSIAHLHGLPLGNRPIQKLALYSRVPMSWRNSLISLKNHPDSPTVALNSWHGKSPGPGRRLQVSSFQSLGGSARGFRFRSTRR
jgi:hypothetical protein